MSYDSSIFNINPYYDDFSTDKSFLRVLFKPGYAVQARELTQIQSILQDQVSKVGDYLFKDGSRIVGGAISVRNTNYVMVSTSSASLSGISDYSFVLGATVKVGLGVSASQPEGRVVHYIPPDTTDSMLVLVVDFISGSSFLGNSSVVLLTDTDNPVSYTLTIGTDSWSNGSCKLVSVDDGIFYVDGFFARNFQQYFVPGTTTANGTGVRRDFQYGTAFSDLTTSVGFGLVRDSVTENEDATLRDPAIGSYNYNAPGADRYVINLTLDQRVPGESTNDFLEVLRFDAGKITKKIERITYAEIEKTLSQRTYDESGSYVVNPFDINVSISNSQLQYTLGSGKAYVQGHELETQYPQTVSAPTAITETTETDLLFPLSVGNWIGVCAGYGTDVISSWGSTFSAVLGTTLNNGSADVYFRNSIGNVVGQAKVHGMVPFGFVTGTGLTQGKYKMYLYGICAGSVISGASSAVVMPHGSVMGSGKTLAVFGATTVNTPFGTINKTDDAALVYDVKPGYAIKNFNAVEFYGKIITNTITPQSTVTTPATYTATISSDLSGTFSALNNTSVSFPPIYGVGGSGVASDIQQVTLLSTGNAGTTAQAYSPGHAASMVGFTLSSDGNYIKLEIPVGQHPTGFTTGNVRMVVPVKYTLDSTVLNSGDPTSSDIRTKTATAATYSTSVLTADPNRNNKKYLLLPQWDVYSITSITHSTMGNITSYFELDDGQRETYYDYSRLYLKAERNSSVTTGTILVSYSYFLHSGLAFGPFVGANSYTGVDYSSIPLYTNSRTGRTVSLANCLDFRHSGPITSAPTVKPFGFSEFSAPFANTKVSYSHYLPRIDKIKVQVNSDTNAPVFSVVSGDPDMNPVAPPDTEDALTLYTVLVPAYTHKASDVLVTPYDNKRYTMQDIGKIEKRVGDVETFASLSVSELQTESKSLLAYARVVMGSPITIEPLKTSIYVDEFVGHNSGDVASDEHICSVDYEYGELRPFFTAQDVLLPVGVASGVTVSGDGLCTLSYTTTPHTENIGYTKTIKPNPTNTTNWLGFVQLSKTIDTLWDTGFRALVKTNSLGENDNWLSSDAVDARGFGTQWNDWESMWTGIEIRQEENDTVQRAILELPRTGQLSQVSGIDSGNVSIGVGRRINATTSEKMLSYMKSRKLKNRISTTIEGRIVDKSVVPYISTQSIALTAYGLKPNTSSLSVWFDGVEVLSGLASDSSGTVSTTFTIPAATFTVGEKLVRITDSYDPENASTTAECVFYSTGIFTQRDSGSYSTRSPSLRRQTVASNGIIKSPFNRDVSYDDVTSNQWTDPLCQTFIVDAKSYPNGIFASSIDLFFSKKDSLLPVTVQIRPTVNGYPSPSVSLPFSTVTKLPVGVTTAMLNGTPKATGFTFSSPVYLEPGEYAVAVLTNSGQYSLYAASSGANTQNAGRAGNNASVGTLYVPQNTNTWVPDNVTDIAFRLNRCSFDSLTTGYVQYTSTNTTKPEVLKVSSSEIIPLGCSVQRLFGDTTALTNNQNTYLRTMPANLNLKYTLSRGVNTAVSPVVDFGTFFGKMVNMKLSGSSSNPFATSSYVSRVVTLPQDSASQGVFVFSDAVVPSGATVNMYCRYSASSESDLFQSAWRPMTRLNAFTSTTESDFREAVYGITGQSGVIGSYQIKSEFLAKDTSVSGSGFFPYSYTPALKNISVVTWK